ncbi:hypothetical protein Adu01nite_87770 [Paractinoplanes durhamensis]|uniref:Uncharacterized protein n=1 Tax=Paractinoplanes durhamensis TaxID=113563 RepID=A0ABQ3ZC80_9ACTN|nr:hypothetical protein Adu01nite_87770 [Actinoplanes durhamensis]
MLPSAGALLRILHRYRAEFPPAERPVAPAPALPDRVAIYRYFEQEALAGVGRFRWYERDAARLQAGAWCEAEVSRRWFLAQERQVHQQQELDRKWHLLIGNDPETVRQALAAAFEDIEAAACAVVRVKGAEVTLTVTIPPVSAAIPGDVYRQFVHGQALVALRTAFAAAPGLAAARVTVLSNDPLASFSVTRQALDQIRWHAADATDIVDAVARRKGEKLT